MDFLSIDIYKILEIIASLFGLVFLFLIIKQKISCWIFGIIASAINVFLLIHVKLYSEAILYSFYIFTGIYGWIKWSSPKNDLKISVADLSFHLLWIFIGIILAVLVGFYFSNYTDARLSYLDSFSSVFAIIATILEARKILHAWIYWIILNTYTIFLYANVDLPFRSGEMLIYAIFSFVGFYSWRKSYKTGN